MVTELRLRFIVPLNTEELDVLLDSLHVLRDGSALLDAGLADVEGLDNVTQLAAPLSQVLEEA